MVTECKDYGLKGYCLRGRQCAYEHGIDNIELDISGYDGLIEAMQEAVMKAAAITKEQQYELKRKQTDLLSSLVSQQRALIRKIELCADEAEKVRLKTALDEMSQKTKDWIDQEGARSKQRDTVG